MKYLCLFSLLLSSFSHAENFIPWDEVIDAFVWIKIVPGSPLVMNEETEDYVSFRIFDDVYTITRERKNFKVNRLHYQNKTRFIEESASLDSMVMEKILKFSKAKKRAEAVLSKDIFQQSIRTKKIPSGFQASQTLYQCSSDLPSRITRDGSVVNQILHHTWIQNGATESFGMPNTDEGDYFGGTAHLRTPDSFIIKGPKHLKCSPVFIPSSQVESEASQRLVCIARSLSLPQNPIFEEKMLSQDWVAHLDYHALERNCLMAVRFVLECGGAKASQVVNTGIGGKFKWNDLYSMSTLTPDLKPSILGVRVQLKRLRAQESILNLPDLASKIIDRALELDAKLRGALNQPQTKSLREICDLALQECPN